MLRFISLTMKNFMSFGNNVTVIDLERNGTTLIVGEDLDNTANGQGANGVGKTTIINALSYGVYDKAVSSISKDNLVNNINKKNMEVTVTFEYDSKFYHIKRVRKSKAGAAGNYVEFYEREEDCNFEKENEVTRDSVHHTNDLIADIIGIPYELFVRIVVFSATHVPFLDLPVRHVTGANQTGIIEELFDLTQLSAKAEMLKQHIKDKDLELDRQILINTQLEKEHIRHADQIKSARTRVINWEEQNVNNIDSLNKKLKKLDNINIDLEKEYHDDLSVVEDNLSTSLTEQRSFEKTIVKHSKVIKEMEGELKHLNDETCPYCLQSYENTGKKIDECEHTIISSNKNIDIVSVELEDVDLAIGILNDKKGELNKLITVQNLDELIDIAHESESIQSRIDEMKTHTNPFIEPMDELESIKLDTIKYDEVNEIKKHIDHQKFLLKLLTKKDSFVRKALLNKNIPFLNSKLQGYLNDLGLPHKVEFTHQLTAEISQFGREMDFGNLSNGQRARVNIALSFAFRDVLQSLHTKVNVCLLDEVLDVGLDAVGVQSAARMLKRKARDEDLALYIISHRDEIDSAFDSKMVVQMSKGFSYITEEEV